MTPDRWKDVERLYHAARAEAPEARPAFLAKTCGGDEALRQEVQSLLAHASASGVLDRAGMSVAEGRLGGEAPSTNRIGRRLGVYSVPQLKAAIREFIAAHHAKATPFVWTKSADQILAGIARFAQRTLDFQPAPVNQRTTRSGH